MMPCQVINEVIDEREGVSVWYCPFIQVVVVLYWAEFSIFLLDKEESTGIGGVGMSDSFQLEILGEELLLFFFFLGG
jgi:hypothetical protein